MPEFYGSQRLFWYLIVATTLNGASLDAASAAPAVVSAPLTRGGRLVGTLTATVGLVVSRPD